MPRSLRPLTLAIIATSRASWAAATPETRPQVAAPTEPADRGPAAPPADARWYGYDPASGLPPPGSVPAPAPRSGAEHWRRPIEFYPEAGLVAPLCHHGTQGSDRCDGIQAGGEVGAAILWRVSAYFGWGGTLDVTGFRYAPPPRLGLRSASAAAVFVGLLGRAYFGAEGPVEPYIELGLGGGALGRGFRDRDGHAYDETGAGPALRLGAGAEFYVGPRVRLGPVLDWTALLVDKIRRCRASGSGECVDVSKHDQGYLSGLVSLTMRVTFLFGEEL
jgi:hypothetical protein